MAEKFKLPNLLGEGMIKGRQIATLAVPEWQEHISEIELRQILNECVATAIITAIVSRYVCLHPKCRLLLKDDKAIFPHIRYFHPEQLKENSVGRRKRKAAWKYRSLDNMDDCPAGKKFLFGFKDKDSNFYEKVSTSETTVLYTSRHINATPTQFEHPIPVHNFPAHYDSDSD
ncbi:Oidioi.mRNA.OKI2018_I69.chr2.g4122.t1.cds [Oikopleura dioica]|nr:Oidioi.mRNA.OKI2018_I69.chr2.g4122.t1.cds [Oikopleura dioica]